MRELEILRRDRIIGNALEAVIEVQASGATLELLRSVGEHELADIFLVSAVHLAEGPAEGSAEGGPIVRAYKSAEPKCPRCWRQGHGIGSSGRHPDICERCAEVIDKLIAAGELNGIAG